MVTTKTRKPGELVFNGVLVILSLFFVVQSFLISGVSEWSAPGVFPLLASSVMLISTVCSLFKTLQSRPPTLPVISFWRRVLPRQILMMILLVTGFAFALNKIGFVLSSFCFLLLAIKLFHRRSWLYTLLISLISLTVIYMIFRGVFQVILPEGEWLSAFPVIGTGV